LTLVISIKEGFPGEPNGLSGALTLPTNLVIVKTVTQFLSGESPLVDFCFYLSMMVVEKIQKYDK